MGHVFQCEGFSLHFQFFFFPSTALQDDTRPVQEAASPNPIPILQNLHSLRIGIWNTLSIHHGRRLLFQEVTRIIFTNAVVTERLHCQLPIPRSQACYACRSLADKYFQAISSGNPSANQATAITRSMCAIPSWGLRNVDFLVSNNPTKNSVPFLQPCFSCATAVDKPEKD